MGYFMNQRMIDEITLRKNLEKKRALRIRKWSKGDSPGPFKLMYFPTNICNLECAICWQRQGVHDFTEISPKRQRTIINDAINLGIQELVIGGGGEPLIRWNRLVPLFNKALEKKIYFMLFTNGTLITPKIAQKIINLRFNKVLISIDGPQKINDEIREPGSFEKAIKGLKYLLKARAQSSYPIIGISCVMTRQGIKELPLFLRYLGRLGCDQFNLIRLVVYVEEQRRFAIPFSKLEKTNQIIMLAQKEAQKAGMVTNLAEYLDDSLITKTESFNTVLQSDNTISLSDDNFWNSLCFEPFSNMVIHANGEVGPCCMSGDAPLTSVMNRSLSDIWYGEEFKQLRKGILSRRPESYCRICDLNVFAENQRLRKIGSGE